MKGLVAHESMFIVDGWWPFIWCKPFDLFHQLRRNFSFGLLYSTSNPQVDWDLYGCFTPNLTFSTSFCTPFLDFTTHSQEGNHLQFPWCNPCTGGGLRK